jgi:hypothetical protein
MFIFINFCLAKQRVEVEVVTSGFFLYHVCPGGVSDCILSPWVRNVSLSIIVNLVIETFAFL